MTIPNHITLAWYANHSDKEILIGPSGYGTREFEELGEVTVAMNILAYWEPGSFCYPVQLLAEGVQVQEYFQLATYKRNYQRNF